MTGFAHLPPFTPTMMSKPAIDLTKLRRSQDKRFYPINVGGEVVEMPSVTTILDGVRVKGFLDKWEHEMIELLGVDGFKKFMKKKADEGTLVHELAELYLKRANEKDDTYFEWTEDIGDVEWKKFNNWVAWYKQYKPKMVWLERTLHSKTHRYAGRSDGLVEIDGELWVIDWKTSEKPQDKHLMQLSAYIKALEEMDGITVKGGMVVALGAKTKQGYSVSTIEGDDVEHYFEGFLKLKDVFDWHFPDQKGGGKLMPVYIVPEWFE